ncbi:MAG TPA: 3-hydroxybutyryl-CoA dehydrogenase [Candidatus Polarisedimenticolia bacterium]|jgi:3-hydroxybutyryl-CoA dehydrogenase|nr:3-hydroxybutyryl-CoA dehydrogenase [Candidatus Polarisedimenticolia bacterium]
MEIKKVGVLGCGLMGSGIAQVAAQSGYTTTVLEVTRELLETGLKRIDQFLAAGVAKGKVRPEDKHAALSRLSGTTDYDSLKDCDLVIEAVIENLGAKKEAFGRLERVLKKEAILASNTSSLSITEMAVTTQRPQRFVGLHFFNPVPLMKLVEVIRTIQTEPGIEEAVLGFAKSLGKVPVRTLDRTGFIVNRLLVPYILDAIRALEEGVGGITDIDQGMKLGCGHPMGPLTLLDLVGIDTTYYIADIMFDEFRERRFAPPPLMKRMVLAGFHGRKTGRGFYDYGSEPPRPNDFLTQR